jgi:novobiocin biosynthesis protein NovI
MTARPVVPPEEIDDIDLADPRLHAERDLSEVWRHLRATRPVHWQSAREGRPGFWVITRHADAIAVYRDKGHFTTERGNDLAMLLNGGDPAGGTMMAVTDGLRHTLLRSIMMKALSPRRLEEMRQELRRRVDALLANAMDDANCDFVRDVGGDVPLGMICDLLAVPESDRKYLLDLTARSWSKHASDTPPEDGRTAQGEILLYFADLADERRGGDGEDVVSLLANSRVDGKYLSNADVMANCYGMMIGGDEAPHHAISMGLLALLEHPDAWSLLKSGGAQLETAAEEVLRWTVPALHAGRTATGDVTVGGQLIRSGDVVSVWISSANRDAEVFEDPDRFDLNRSPNEHLSFGFGKHFCIGHYLGRMEVQAVLDGLRRMVGSIEQVGPERWIYSDILHGLSSLPVVLRGSAA